MIALGIIITFIGGLFLLYDLYVFLALGESGDGLFLLISASVTALGIFMWRMGLKREAAMIEREQQAIQNGTTPHKRKGPIIATIILILIVATPFLLNFIPDTPVNREELVLQYVDDWMKNTEKSMKDTDYNISSRHTKPRIVDNSGNIYFVYTERTMNTFGNEDTMGDMIVVKIEGKNRCSILTDAPMSSDADEEELKKSVEMLKNIYGKG